MPSNKTSTQMDDYTNIAKLNSMKLIRLVRQNEALYDNDAIGYNDKWNKDMIWERIHQGLYPDYQSLSDAMKETIRANVRRRWKTLRDAIGREVRKTATVENYCRKKGNPILAELEFLIPHIKSAYCAKLTDELNLRDSQNSIGDLNKYEMDDLGETDDMHDMLDIKPFNMNTTNNVGENISGGVASTANTSGNGEDDSLMFQAHSALYPLVQMKTSETGDGLAATTESNLDQLESRNIGVDVKTRCAKRARSEDQSDFQTKVLQSLTNLERRIERHEQQQEHADQRDEDRMFLLSLVGDLKSIPAAKKMLVKAEIATAIARAGQS